MNKNKTLLARDLEDTCWLKEGIMPSFDVELFANLIITKCASIAEDCYTYHRPLSSVPEQIRKFERIYD